MKKDYFVVRRLFASLFDLLILAIIFSFFLIYPISNLIKTINNGDSINNSLLLLIAMLFGAIVVSIFLFVTMLASSWKATLGMRLFSLVLTSSNYKELTLGRIIIRESYTIFTIVLSLGLILIANLLLIIINDKSKTFNDVFTYTKVVDAL